MYEINGKSWHWRLVVDQYPSYGWRRQVSLCRYFWTVVWCVVRGVSGYPFRKPAGFVTYPLLVGAGYVVPTAEFFMRVLANQPFSPIAVLGFLEAVATVIVVCIYCGFKTLDKWGEEAINRISASSVVAATERSLVKVKNVSGGALATVGTTLFHKHRPVTLATTAVLVFLFYVVPMYTLYLCNNDFNQPHGVQLAGWIGLLFVIGILDLAVTGAAALFGLLFCVLFLVDRLGIPAFQRAAESETWRLVKAFAKAKKEKVCPLLAVPKNY